MSSVWVVEAKKPDDSEEEWTPLLSNAFLSSESATYRARKMVVLACGAWTYRAAEYIRKDPSE